MFKSRSVRLLGSVLTVVAALGSTATHASAQRDFGAMRMLMEAADADADGQVPATEWAAFVDSLPVDDRAGITRGDLLARLLGPALGVDAAGDWAVADARAALAPLSEDERAGMTFAETLARDVLATAWDTNQDGDFTDSEKQAFLDWLEARESSKGALAAVIEMAAAVPPPDDNRNAMTPGVFLVTLEGALDQNRNGRIGPDDLHALHVSHDVDGDGTVTMEEVRSATRAASRPRGRNWIEEGDAIDWASRRPAMPWQRSLEDAQALSVATGKPMLICVNMDGETASDTMAARQYRDPRFVELARGFIPLIVSPDKHQARDHADDGTRLLDPRFGRVVDREHIDIEPMVYEAYFQGRRVAPRHVGVSPDGEILFDLYLLNDLSIIDTTLEQHGVLGPLPVATTEEELLASPDAAHREQLEAAFVAAGAPDRMRLIANALSVTREVQHPELLRLGLFGDLEDVRIEAAWAAVRTPHLVPSDLWPGVQRVAATSPNVHAAFVAALEREAQRRGDRQLQRAASLAGLQLDDAQLSTWSRAMLILRSGPTAAPLPRELARMYRVLDAYDRQPELSPEDHLLRAGLAHTLAFARLRAGQDPTGLFEESRRSSSLAMESPSTADRAAAWMAIASYQLSDFEAAANAAALALPQLLEEAGSERVANVLDVLARARTRSIYAALRPDAQPDAQPWNAEHVGQVWLAYRLLLEHPYGTVDQAKAGLEFLGAVGLLQAQTDVARAAAVRFPEDAQVHQWLRFVVLRDQGAAALATVYDGLDNSPTPTWSWFQGLAEFTAGEWALQQADEVTASHCYQASIDRFEAVAAEEAGFADSALHYVALAQGALARNAWAAGDVATTTDRLILSARARPASWAVEDGLGRTNSQLAEEVLSKWASSSDASAKPAFDGLSQALEEAGVRYRDDDDG